jgi:pantoate--beta-alanine ligase
MSLRVIETIAQLRQHLSEVRRAGRRIGLVPTMGALHDGHARLISQARAGSDVVVVSIFVNPTQFDREDDLRLYPRTMEADTALCESLGADVIFAPAVAEMYPVPLACSIEVGRLADHLCGAFRPGHFKGVATVVMKLLQIVQADRAYFGEKDAQQLAIIRRLVVDFNVPVEIVGVPTVREHDGLALSSRNRRLSPEDRRRAIALHQALETARAQIASGRTDTAAIRREAAATVPQSDGVKVEYLEIVEPVDMQPVERVTGPVVVAGAMWVGGVRLIDNIRT